MCADTNLGVGIRDGSERGNGEKTMLQDDDAGPILLGSAIHVTGRGFSRQRVRHNGTRQRTILS
jgi:hypothetical protein